ncbi:MAG: TetR/AcrR family transcriptional regulator [Solirubrobacterales bacterium]|nr:TetR/AcrR family transcriptional regulator [Solirubrobacterales bacterium]HMT05822.1 TetR/AcrR family transcriptional regulator [Solirubrobacterales bacterium]
MGEAEESMHDGQPVVRRRLPAAERRKLILEAGLDAFAEGGYQETTLDEVADRAGISKALIYEHFPSKRDLYREILETWIGDLLGRVLAAATAAGGQSEARLVAGLDGFLAFVEERRDAWRLLIRHRASDDVSETFDRLFEEVARIIGALMAPEMPASSLPEGAAFDLVLDATSRQLMGSVTAVANWWDEHREVPRQQVLEMVMEFAWVGMERASAGERWSSPER